MHGKFYNERSRRTTYLREVNFKIGKVQLKLLNLCRKLMEMMLCLSQCVLSSLKKVEWSIKDNEQSGRPEPQKQMKLTYVHEII